MRCQTTEFFLCGRSSKTFLLASLSGERCSGGQLLSTFSDLAGGQLPIVFGLNLIHFYDGKNNNRTGQDLNICLRFSITSRAARAI